MEILNVHSTKENDIRYFPPLPLTKICSSITTSTNFTHWLGVNRRGGHDKSIGSRMCVLRIGSEPLPRVVQYYIKLHNTKCLFFLHHMLFGLTVENQNMHSYVTAWRIWKSKLCLVRHKDYLLNGCVIFIPL